VSEGARRYSWGPWIAGDAVTKPLDISCI